MPGGWCRQQLLQKLPAKGLEPAPWILDPELLQAETQRIGVQAQNPSSPPGPLDDVVRFCKDTDDVGPLHFLEARGRERVVAGGEPLLEGVIDLDNGATGENRGA